MTTPMNRRQFARGAAWSAPALTLAGAAPALAASPPPPKLTSATFFGQSNVAGQTVNPYSCNGQLQFQVDGVRSGQFFTVSNTVAGTPITNITMTFWLATAAGTTWTRVSGSSTCWSIPSATGATTTYDGATFRAYTTTFNCTAVPSGSTYTIPTSQMFNFVSSCQGRSSALTSYYHYTQTALTRGVALTKDNGWTNVMV